MAMTPKVRDSIHIQPMFHPFPRLPCELQQYILSLVVSKTTYFRIGGNPEVGFCELRGPRVYLRTGEATDEFHDHPGLPKALQVFKSETTLPTIFSISKSLNQELIPWVYRTTNFLLETYGFTNFMWRCGPENRKHIKQLTISFGQVALLHCVRWLAPDPVFELFDPIVRDINPPAMQYFWRLQIQDLAKEVHLSVLTIDIKDIPVDDITFVTRTLRECFGSVQRVRFVKSNQVLRPGIDGVDEYMESKTWGELCRNVFERDVNRPWQSPYFGIQRKKGSIDHLLVDMKEQYGEFFEKIHNDKHDSISNVAAQADSIRI